MLETWTAVGHEGIPSVSPLTLLRCFGSRRLILHGFCPSQRKLLQGERTCQDCAHHLEQSHLSKARHLLCIHPTYEKGLAPPSWYSSQDMANPWLHKASRSNFPAVSLRCYI